MPTPTCHHDVPAKRNTGQCNKCDALNDTQGPQHGQPALVAVETQAGSGLRALQGAAPSSWQPWAPSLMFTTVPSLPVAQLASLLSLCLWGPHAWAPSAGTGNLRAHTGS